MPITNPVHYNSGTTLNHSISKNQISFGVNNVDYGPTSKTKWYANTPIYGYIIVSDSYSQGLTSEENSYPIFWGQASSEFSGLTSLIDGLPARSGQTPFADIESAITWLEGEGIYGIQNRTYENIATSGLTLLYDAGATLSYPTVNNTIYNLGSSNINGTLQNAPSFNDLDGGYLTFSASNSQYITFNDLGTLSNFTVGCWFRLNQSITPATYPTLVTNTYGSGNHVNYTLGLIPSSDKISGGYFNTTWISPEGFTPNIGEWYYVVVTYDGNTVKLYRDGLLFSEVDSTASAVSTGLGGRIARRWDSGQYLNADIGIVQIYNRALSYLEVYQNMSAQAGRYSVPIPPIPYFATSDALLMNSSNKNVYKYDFGTNTITTLFTATTANQVSQIAATQDKIFISDITGIIYEYSYSPIPFEVNYETSYNFTSGFTSGMTAVDNNTLLIGNDSVYRFNLSADTIELLFEYTGGTCPSCGTYKGLIYNSITKQIATNYLNGGSQNVSIYGISGTPISSISYSSYSGMTYPDLQTQVSGVFVSQNSLYLITNSMYIYQADFNGMIIYPPTQPSNLTTETANSATSISLYSIWPTPAPYFNY
jgi:hypothetical protein